MRASQLFNQPTRTKLRRRLEHLTWRGSEAFWERNYAQGGNSGSGSYGRLAEFKADVLNGFVDEHSVTSVIEFGCGDGNQLSLSRYPQYFGLDVASGAIDLCMARFANDSTKSFAKYEPARFRNNGAVRADLAISLDVIFHLVEDNAFEAYMTNLFTAATQWVGIFSSNTDKPHPEAYTRHHRFTDWVEKHEPDWRLLRKVDNPHGYDPGSPYETSFADFYFFQRAGQDTNA